MDDKRTTEGSQHDQLWVVAGLAAGFALVAALTMAGQPALASLAVGLVAVQVLALWRTAAVRRILADTRGWVRYFRWKATHDDLTGLPNRATLQNAIDEARRAGADVSAMLVVLGDVPAINDRHGHLAGDAVVRVAARRLRANLRTDDFVGRIGGGEFLVVLDTPTTADELHRVVARVIHVLGQPIGVDGLDVMMRVSAHVGVACVDGAVADYDHTISACDRALHDSIDGPAFPAFPAVLAAPGGTAISPPGQLHCVDDDVHDRATSGSDI